MEPRQKSMTALSSAYVRALHHAHDDPKIFDDPIAPRLLTASERESFDTLMSDGLERFDSALAASCPDRHAQARCYLRAVASAAEILTRARYAEDILVEVIRNGVRQYVLVGAGMDTFAFRQPVPTPGLQVFEVDHPATQAFKRQRLAEAELVPPATLHFVPVDLAYESLGTALAQSPYVAHVPTCFAWVGVTPYLDRDAVFATLQAIRSVTTVGSHLVFDYFDTDAFVPDKVAKRVRVFIENVRRLGEPFYAGLDPDTLSADLLRVGFRLREHLHPQDMEARYFQGRTGGYQACEHAHFVWAVAA